MSITFGKYSATTWALLSGRVGCLLHCRAYRRPTIRFVQLSPTEMRDVRTVHPTFIRSIRVIIGSLRVFPPKTPRFSGTIVGRYVNRFGTNVWPVYGEYRARTTRATPIPSASQARGVTKASDIIRHQTEVCYHSDRSSAGKRCNSCKEQLLFHVHLPVGFWGLNSFFPHSAKIANVTTGMQ